MGGTDKAQHDGVDWDHIERQLRTVPAEFKVRDATSLKHIMEILSRDNGSAVLAEMHGELEKTQQLINTIVNSNFLGFSTGIASLTKIVHHFRACHADVAKIRSDFEDAKLGLETVSLDLRSRWETNTALKDNIATLRDVKAVSVDYKTLQSLVSKSDWQAAVPVLLRLSNRLLLSSLQPIGALAHIRKNVPDLYKQISSALVDETLDLVLTRPDAATERAEAAPATGAGGSNVSAPRSNDGSAANAPGSRTVSVVTCCSQGGAAADPAAAAESLPVTHHPRLAQLLARQAAAGEGAAAVNHEAAQVGDERVTALVGALVQLDALELLRSRLRSLLELQMFVAMKQAIAATPLDDKAIDSSVQSMMNLLAVRSFAPAGVYARVSGAVTMALVAVHAIARHATWLLGAMLRTADDLARARRNFGRVLLEVCMRPEDAQLEDSSGDDIEAVRTELQAAASSDAEYVLLTAQRLVIGMLAVTIKAPYSHGAVIAEAAYGEPSDTRGVRSGTKWLQQLLRKNALGKHRGDAAAHMRQHHLRFSFGGKAAGSSLTDLTGMPSTMPATDDLAEGQPDAMQHTPIAYENMDFTGLAGAILAQTVSPSPVYVVPVYPALVNFCEHLNTLRTIALGLPAGLAGRQGSRRGRDGPSSESSGSGSGPDGHDPAGMLRDFANGFVAATLLPHASAEARRLSAAIIGQSSGYVSVAGPERDNGVTKSIVMLRGVRGICALFQELSEWAEAMPPYASQLAGIATNAMSLHLRAANDALAAAVASDAVLRGVWPRDDVHAAAAQEDVLAYLSAEGSLVGAAFEVPMDATKAGGDTTDELTHAVMETLAHSYTDEYKSEASTLELAKRLAAVHCALIYGADIVDDVFHRFAPASLSRGPSGRGFGAQLSSRSLHVRPSQSAVSLASGGFPTLGAPSEEARESDMANVVAGSRTVTATMHRRTASAAPGLGSKASNRVVSGTLADVVGARAHAHRRQASLHDAAGNVRSATRHRRQASSILLEAVLGDAGERAAAAADTAAAAATPAAAAPAAAGGAVAPPAAASSAPGQALAPNDALPAPSDVLSSLNLGVGYHLMTARSLVQPVKPESMASWYNRPADVPAGDELDQDVSTGSDAALRAISVRMKQSAVNCLKAIRLHVMACLAHGIVVIEQNAKRLRRVREAVPTFSEEATSYDIEPTIQQLLRTLQRLQEELSPYLADACIQYIFSDVRRVACCLIMQNLVSHTDAVGTARIERFLQLLRMLQSVQFGCRDFHMPPINDTVDVQATVTKACSRTCQKAEAMLRLLLKTPEELVTDIEEQDKSSRRLLSPAAYRCVLSIDIAHRVVTREHWAAVARALRAAGQDVTESDFVPEASESEKASPERSRSARSPAPLPARQRSGVSDRDRSGSRPMDARSAGDTDTSSRITHGSASIGRQQSLRDREEPAVPLEVSNGASTSDAGRASTGWRRWVPQRSGDAAAVELPTSSGSEPRRERAAGSAEASSQQREEGRESGVGGTQLSAATSSTSSFRGSAMIARLRERFGEKSESGTDTFQAARAMLGSSRSAPRPPAGGKQ